MDSNIRDTSLSRRVRYEQEHSRDRRALGMIETPVDMRSFYIGFGRWTVFLPWEREIEIGVRMPSTRNLPLSSEWSLAPACDQRSLGLQQGSGCQTPWAFWSAGRAAVPVSTAIARGISSWPTTMLRTAVVVVVRRMSSPPAARANATRRVPTRRNTRQSCRLAGTRKPTAGRATR